jgi:endonuclease I
MFASTTPALLVLLFSFNPTATFAQVKGGKQDYPDCGPSTYYQPLPATKSQWTKKAVGGLLANTHRNVLELQSLAQALVELDIHPEGGVSLIYSDKAYTDANVENFDQPDTWTREHLWPDSRGAVGGFAFTDIHNSRPEATRVTMIRKDMMYGECATVEFADVCEKPAFGGADLDTSQDGKVWMPPEQVRGDIARAIMYMEVRYHDTDLNLTLSDCPPFTGKMGILSQLLEWHAADPVSPEEYNRNQYACQYWQGNRNPFVDYPELVEQFYGQPQQIAPGTRTYPTCLNIPTPAPTAVLNECSQLAPGDVFIYVVESDDPDGVGFMALEPIPGGLELYMTDNPWNGYDFVGNEGVVKVRSFCVCDCFHLPNRSKSHASFLRLLC